MELLKRLKGDKSSILDSISHAGLLAAELPGAASQLHVPLSEKRWVLDRSPTLFDRVYTTAREAEALSPSLHQIRDFWVRSEQIGSNLEDIGLRQLNRLNKQLEDLEVGFGELINGVRAVQRPVAAVSIQG